MTDNRATKDYEFMWIVLIICLTILLKAGINSYSDYKKAKIELEQPKYIIELNQEAYELKKID